MSHPIEIPEPFLQLVALAVQGMFNRRPQIAPHAQPLARHLNVEAYGGQDKALRTFVLYIEYPLPEGLYFVYRPVPRMYQHLPEPYRWVVRSDEKGRFLLRETTFSKAERAVSSAFTKPFVVERVSKEAIAEAKAFILQSDID